MISRRAIALVFLLGSAACTAGGSVEGTVAGQPLVVRDALFGTAADGKSTVVALFDREGMCEAFESKTLVANSRALALYIKPETGTWILGGPGGARDFEGTFTMLDDQCAPDPSLGRAAGRAQSGTVTLDAIETMPDGRAKGRFDLLIGPQGDAVRGEFSARRCAALGQNLGERPACQKL